MAELTPLPAQPGDLDPVTLTGVIRWDIQPQVEGGNTAVMQALSDTLAQYDPTLAPNIVEGLRSPETAQTAIDALNTNTTSEQKLDILNGLAPFSTSPDHYAYRNPLIEYDVSLMNHQAMADMATTQTDTQQAAQVLMQRGELATADTMNYLARQGITDTQQAFVASDAMREAMRHLDHSLVQTQIRGDRMGAFVTVPGAPLPMLNAVGPVQNGVWTPMVDGFAISTPARQQLMEQFSRPDVKAQLQQQGVYEIAPVFRSSAEPNVATRPPTQQQVRSQTPRWEDIEKDPRFAQLPPERQQAMKKAYFDNHTALTPPVKNVIREDPRVFSSLKDRFVNTAQYMFGPVGSAIAGAIQGFVPESVTQKIEQISGEHPLAKLGGQIGSDIATTPFLGPVAGPLALETARAAAEAAYKGLPLITNASDLVSESIPVFGAENKSILSSANRAALGQAILWKYAPPVLKKAGSFAKAVGQKFGTAGQAVVRMFSKGGWTGKDLGILTRIAKNNQSNFTLWVADQILSKLPDIRITQGKTLRIVMKDRTIVDENSFSAGTKSILERMQADPNFRPDFVELPELQNVQYILGPAQKVNAFFNAQGMALEVLRADAAKGANVRQVRGMFEVRQGSTLNVFDTAEKAYSFIDDLPALPTLVEQQGFKRLFQDGVNPFYITTHITNPAAYVGEVPGQANYGDIAAQMGIRWFMAPRTRMLQIESRGGAPLFSQVYNKLEPAIIEAKNFAEPYEKRLVQILKGVRKRSEQAKQYTLLMDHLPASQDWNTAIAKHGLDPQKAQALWDLIMEFTSKMGLNGLNIMHNVFPQIRRFGSVNGAYQTGNLPKEVTYFLEDFLNGSLPVADRELTIHSLMDAMISQGSFKLKAEEAWRNAAQVAHAIIKRPAESIEAMNYLRTMRGWGSQMDQVVADAVGQLVQRVTLGHIDPLTTSRVTKELLGQIYAWNFGAYFGLRPSAMIRQTFQLVQTIYPRFGEVATSMGILKAGVRSNWDRLRESGAVMEDPYHESGFAGWASRGVGMADNLMRAVSGFSQEYLFDKHILDYTTKKIDWQTFASRSHLSLMQENEQKVLKDLIDGGNAYMAKLKSMLFASNDTNFNYTPQNRPPILNSIYGQLFGKFGAYPAYYGNYIGHMMTRGSIPERMLWLTRFVGAHVATYEALRVGFNADARNQLFLGPLDFVGSPLWTKIWHVEQTFLGHGQSQREAQRDVGNVWHWAGTFTTGGSAVKDWMDAAGTTSGADFIREFGLALPAYDKNK